MTKSFKNIIITFIIGCSVFVIGNLLSGGFDYKNVNDFLIDFVFYQLTEQYYFEHKHVQKLNNINDINPRYFLTTEFDPSAPTRYLK